ncbi:heterocyst differentiation ATP-binding protein HepA [mine drainage metagenome]|uniref:Heterocyst differentiation ATP-binding protein HepA n=1 Tax=mine drainage metagenome TaxID=410659 RepID=A0A1J5S062_9ZZZZ
MTNQPVIQLLKRLWRHISPRRRGQFGLLLVLILLASFAEILTIGAVLPFLGVLTAPERIFSHPLARPIIHALGLTEPSQLLLPLTIIFVMAAIIAGAMRLLLLWSSTRLTFAAGADLSISIYRRTLYQPYSVHCIRNSSVVIDGISSKASNAIGAINNTLTIISSAVMMTAVLIVLLSVNPAIALSTFGGFGLIYALIIKFNFKRVLADSKQIASESTHVIKVLQEGLGGIRDVLVDGSQEVYCQIYHKANLRLRYAQGRNVFISASPRYVMEALGIVLIAMLAYLLGQQTDGIIKAIPSLGALVLGSQRLLPVLQQAYGAWTNIKGYQVSLQDILELLDQPLPEFANQSVIQQLSFKYNISFRQLDFRYSSQTPYVLKHINLTIDKGSRVGFIGTTGSGKSTLIDVVMGLLPPTDGVLEVDGQSISPSNSRAWQTHIAHVPQAIFLADSSIEENIAFGVPKDQIDLQRVRQAAQQAQIADSIESWPMQYQTFVGERGIRLSGGQRQRIGIARALYKQADVIIFDEATSALDSETEQAIMHAIEGLGDSLTILIIAHRLSTLSNCSKIVELRNGGINRIGTYQEIVTLTA